MKIKITTDWYILPSWGRGLAIGTIVGAILMVPSAFFVKSYSTIAIPFIILISSAIMGILITKNNKSFGLKHN